MIKNTTTRKYGKLTYIYENNHCYDNDRIRKNLHEIFTLPIHEYEDYFEDVISQKIKISNSQLFDLIKYLQFVPTGRYGNKTENYESVIYDNDFIFISEIHKLQELFEDYYDLHVHDELKRLIQENEKII